MITSLRLKNTEYSFVFKWLALWASLVGVSLFLFKANGYDGVHHPEVVVPYFFLITIFGLWYYNIKSDFLKRENYQAQLIGILISSLLFFIASYILFLLTPIPTDRYERLTDLGFLYALLKPGTVLLKYFDIMFQQVFIWGFIHYFNKRGMDKWKLINLFGLTFFVLHLPLFIEFGFMGMIFILPSLVGAMGFAYSLLNLKYGYVWSVGMHFSFYIVLGYIMRLYY
jgi:hypothetical protein